MTSSQIPESMSAQVLHSATLEPREKPFWGTAEQRPGSLSGIRHQGSWCESLRVLVADGNQDSADELGWWLHRCGHDPSVVYDGPTALRVAAMHRPQVVLLHLEIPQMDGCRVAKQLRHDFPRWECLLIGITGRTDEARYRQSIESGVDLLLIEPYRLLILETLLSLESVRVQRVRSERCTGLLANMEPTPQE